MLCLSVGARDQLERQLKNTEDSGIMGNKHKEKHQMNSDGF